jgi:hypothetical protein
MCGRGSDAKIKMSQFLSRRELIKEKGQKKNSLWDII